MPSAPSRKYLGIRAPLQGAGPLSASLRPARRTGSPPSPCSVVLRGLTAHPLRLGCRPFRGQAPRSSFVALLHHTQRYASVARLAGAAHRRSRCVKLFTRRYTQVRFFSPLVKGRVSQLPELEKKIAKF